MENCVALNIPLGYRIVDKIKSVSVWDAEAILVSKKQKYYTKAVRSSDKADLVESLLVCPHCGAEFGTRAKQLHNCVHPRGSRRVSKHEVREWSSMQLSLFDEGRSRIIRLTEPPVRPSLFKCPSCEMKSEFSALSRAVTINRKKKKITIKAELVGLSEILSLQWIGSENFSVCPPMYETLVFDLGRGRVYIKLENSRQELISAMDITGQPEILSDDVLGRLISFNKIVNRTVKRMFSVIWQMPIPFRSKEMTLKNFFSMTEFINYDRAFYSYIPYCAGSVAVEKSFKSCAKALHDAQSLESVYANSALPRAKSARRIFFCEPGLFFYISEAEKMWKAMGDINIFCKMLKSDNVFDILSDLHMRPGIMPYVRDYCKIRGAKVFFDRISESWSAVRSDAVDYATVSETARKSVQKTWLKRVKCHHVANAGACYSVPMHRIDEAIPDCTVNGYDFFWLRNSNDYIVAAIKLDNCLDTWHTNDAPVVCVRQKREYVAAIEVDDRQIIQMWGYKNSPIDDDSKLGIAIEKWRRQYKLDFSYDYYEEYTEE